MGVENPEWAIPQPTGVQLKDPVRLKGPSKNGIVFEADRQGLLEKRRQAGWATQTRYTLGAGTFSFHIVMQVRRSGGGSQT